MTGLDAMLAAIFQRIADWTGDHLDRSPYWLAAYSATIAALGLVVSGVAFAIRCGDHRFAVFSFLMTIWLALSCRTTHADAVKREQAYREAGEVPMPTLTEFTHRHLRAIQMILLVGMSALLISMIWREMTPLRWIEEIDFDAYAVLICAASYFLTSAPNPPKRRRALRFATNET